MRQIFTSSSAALFAFAMLISINASAQVHESQQAVVTARQCVALVQRDSAKRDDARVCSERLGAFIDGWNAGVRRGMRSAFILDEANLQTTKGERDTRDRIEAISERTQCIGRSGVDFYAFADRYIAYVASHAKRWKDRYDEVLQDMIEETLCK